PRGERADPSGYRAGLATPQVTNAAPWCSAPHLPVLAQVVLSTPRRVDLLLSISVVPAYLLARRDQASAAQDQYPLLYIAHVGSASTVACLKSLDRWQGQ